MSTDVPWTWFVIDSIGHDVRMSMVALTMVGVCWFKLWYNSACILPISLAFTYFCAILFLVFQVPCSIGSFLLCNHTCCRVGNELVVLGGGGNCFSFGTYLNSELYSINIDR